MVKSASIFIGGVYSSNKNGDFEVLEYYGRSDIKIRFLSTGYVTKTSAVHIRSGKVKDRFHPNVCGVGFLGETRGCEDYKSKLSYETWRDMLNRCYNENRGRFPAYSGCTVSDLFKNYSLFDEWCTNQKGFGNRGWCLDKDLIVKDNRVYSENTCVFIPEVINLSLVNRRYFRGDLPIGISKSLDKFSVRLNKNGERFCLGSYETVEEAFYVYKSEKEKYLKSLAEKYKSVIDVRAYNALMKYQVEIDD